MRRPYLVALCLGLVACGDDTSAGKSTPGATAPSPDAPLTAGNPSTADLEALAAKARATGGAPNPAGARAAKELTDAVMSRLGPTLEEDGRKARAFAERPLTAADVETYLALYPDVRAAAATQGAVSRLLAERGLSGMEWGVLSGRIGALRMALRVPDAKLDPKTAADVDVLRPFADRLEAAVR